ncbi:hypothetical protein KAT59_01175, partial [Candidatus Bipolaricaulota bacterium]|nr:hypothetical protein [Candidatus Bipolaricaulota bacterium]
MLRVTHPHGSRGHEPRYIAVSAQRSAIRKGRLQLSALSNQEGRQFSVISFQTVRSVGKQGQVYMLSN